MKRSLRAPKSIQAPLNVYESRWGNFKNLGKFALILILGAAVNPVGIASDTTNTRLVCAKFNNDREWSNFDHEIEIKFGRIELCELFSTGRRIKHCTKFQVDKSFAKDGVIHYSTKDGDDITLRVDENFRYRGKSGGIAVDWPNITERLGCWRTGR